MAWSLFKKNKSVEEPKEEVPSLMISQGRHSAPKETAAAPKKSKKPKVKKPKAKVEPKVEVINFDFDPKNPRLGSIELDWNTEFVQLLRQHGYNASTEEEIVDAWLNDVCRNIVYNSYEGSNVTPASLGNIVTKKVLGDGKTEIS